MMFKKLTHSSKNPQDSNRTKQEFSQRSLTQEERAQLFREMNMGWGTMSPGCFPDVIWHLY